MDMETMSSIPTTNDDRQSIPTALTEVEMGWLQASKILLDSEPSPHTQTPPLPEYGFEINESSATPACAPDSSKATAIDMTQESYTPTTSRNHHPQTFPALLTPSASQHRNVLLSSEDAGSYFEKATGAIGAVAGLLTPSADPHLRSSYKALPTSIPSLSHRPSRPKLHALRVQSATLHSSHIPTPRRRLQNTSPKTWHKNRHYHLDGDEQEITETGRDKGNKELPDVFSASSPSWLAELPSLNERETTSDALAGMLTIIPCTSATSTMSLNLPVPGVTPTTPTRSAGGRPHLTRTPPSLSSGERKEWIYRQPKPRTPQSSPSLKVGTTAASPPNTPRSPSRASPSIRPRTSSTSPSASRIPVRQRRISGLPKQPQHTLGSRTGSSRVLRANSIERKAHVLHMSSQTTTSPIASAAGPEAGSSAQSNGGVTPVARPIHSMIPARPSAKRKVGGDGSDERKDIGKEKEKQEGGVMGFWSSLKLRPRGGSLSYLSSKKSSPAPSGAVEENIDVTKEPSPQRSLLPVPLPFSVRAISSSSIMSRKTVKGDEGTQDVTGVIAPALEPIAIPSTTPEPSGTSGTNPESPRIRSSSESSGSSAHSHLTSNTQHSVASDAPSTAPTSPLCSQPSLVKPIEPSSAPIPARPILSRTPSTSSRTYTSSLSGKRGLSTSVAGGGTPSSTKSVTFVDAPTVHYASGDESEDEQEKTPELSTSNIQDDVFVRKVQYKHPSEWPPMIEGRRGLRYGRSRWHELPVDHGGMDFANTSIQEEDEGEDDTLEVPVIKESTDMRGGLKRLVSLTRKAPEISVKPTLMRNLSSSSTKSRLSSRGARPSISGPFALGTFPLPANNSPYASTPASFISAPTSAPSSMLRYQQNSQSANRSTTSLRSTLSIRSHTQSLRGSTSTNPRRPHYKSHSYSHPPRANGILPFLNDDSPASSTISSASSSPSPSPAPIKGSRTQKSPYTMSLRAVPSAESLKSTAGRSVRSLSSVKSTTSTRGFRAWLTKVGEGIGVSNSQASTIDEED